MTTKIQKPAIGCVLAFSVFALMTQASPGALFTFRIDNAGTTDGSPTDDGQNFQQLWTSPVNWILESGDDDGDNGYPDGTDTFTMDRTMALVNNSTRLTNEGATIGNVAGITGTGTGNQDIVFKHGGDNTIGDLTLLASATPFHIREERDRSLTINGVISGPGGLLLSRSGGFSDGVGPDELITITGTSPNTITGSIRLYNDNNSLQPSYWVADKVGAFGLAPTLTLEGRNQGTNISGPAQLLITSNTLGGGGAIDDSATALFIGFNGLLSIDAGVDEVIGEGNLFIDLVGSGTYTEIAPGTYTNSEDWIIGSGTVTVGAPSLPFAITEIAYDPATSMLKLTWKSKPGEQYAVKFSGDMSNWDSDLDDGITASENETTSETFDLSFAGQEGAEHLFFHVEKKIPE